MKKISLLLCTLFITASIFAQQAALGLKAGLKCVEFKQQQWL
jgi:hypothetical protein